MKKIFNDFSLKAPKSIDENDHIALYKNIILYNFGKFKAIQLLMIFVPLFLFITTFCLLLLLKYDLQFNYWYLWIIDASALLIGLLLIIPFIKGYILTFSYNYCGEKIFGKKAIFSYDKKKLTKKIIIYVSADQLSIKMDETQITKKIKLINIITRISWLICLASIGPITLFILFSFPIF